MQNLVLTNRIKETCKDNGITIQKLLNDCQLSKGFIYDVERKNAFPSCDKIARIADFFDVSVDYLLGRTDVPNIQKNSNSIGRVSFHEVNDNNNTIASITSNREEAELSPTEKGIIEIVRNLDFEKKREFLNYCHKLTEK